MTWMEIAAIAKTAHEVTKEHQKGFIHWFLVTCFWKHYFQYLSRSLVIEWAAKIDADNKLAMIEQNPSPALLLMQSESEVEYKNMFGVLEKTIPKIQEWATKNSGVDADKVKRLKDLSKEFSSSDMQEVIAGILAWEYNQPWSFSLKTMDIVKSLSKDDIELFKKFCWLVINGYFILWAFTQTNGNEFRQQNGLQYTDFLRIQELWLFAFRDSSLTLSLISTWEEPLWQTVFQIWNRSLFLRYKSEKNVGIITLTTAGKELRKILDFECPDSYQDWINETLQKAWFETEFLWTTKTE